MSTASIGPHSVFLVSGGARGITAQCVIGLARRFGCRFILLGRSSREQDVPPWFDPAQGEAALKQRIASELTARGHSATPAAIRRLLEAWGAHAEIARTLQRVADAGGSAEYIAADIGDGPALRTALAHIAPGSINGMIHGAGKLADKRIEHKTVADFEAVYRPKIDGLQNMLRCVQPDQLQQLVVFSSAAAFYGNSGQTDYALANEILNKAAYEWKRRYPGCQVLSVNWGPWDGGMVTAERKRRFAERGVDVIPPEAGVKLLADTLASGSDAPLQLLVGSALRASLPPRPPQLKPRAVRRHLSLADNPFLQDHRIGGQAVLPLSFAIGWMADSCEQRCPGYRIVSWSDVQVLKGIVFDESVAESYLLECRELATETSDERCFAVMITSVAQTGQTRYHYRAHLALRPSLPPPPVFQDIEWGEQGALDGATLYTDGTLFHGPSFRGIERVVNLDARRATLRCVLPAAYVSAPGQFHAGTVNPFLLDVMFQPPLVAARRLRSAASLPLACRRGEQYRPLSFDQPFFVTMLLRSNNEHELSADLVAHDAAGQVYLQVFGETVTISQQLNQLFRPEPAAA